MKASKKIVSLFAALCMTVSLIPQTLASAAVTNYQDAYSVISSGDYASYNEEYYTSGIDFTSTGSDGFVSGEGAWIGYNVNFGDKEANTLVMKMRPDLRNGHGKFGVYIDSLDSEPIIVFDESQNIPYVGWSTFAGPGISNYCFNIAQPLTGQHTVYFNAIGSDLATTNFSSFYFLSDKITSPYEKIVPGADTIAWGKPQAFKNEDVNGVSSPVLPIEGGAMYVTGVDFGNGETGGVGATVLYNRWGEFGTGSYEVRLDSLDGPVIGTFDNSEIVSSQYKEYSVQFTQLVTGVHTLVFAVPAQTTIASVQFTEGTAEEVVVPTVPSAYENKAVNVNNAFTSSSVSYSFDMDFGTSVPEYLAINMRPALEDAADGGVINVYFDDDTTEPVAFFATYRNEVSMLPSGSPAIANEWFAPISVPADFGGVHKVIFKSEGNAKSNFNYFRFDKDTETKDAYQSILASSYDYVVHNGNTMWGDSYVYAFGEELSDGEKYKTYYSAAYTKVDFADKSSDKVIVRLNKQSSNSGKVEVRLGSRYGEVIGTLSSDDITLGENYRDNVADYSINLTKTLTGVQDIVFTSDIYTNFYYFRFDEKLEATDENTNYVFSTDNVQALDGGAYSTYNGEGVFSKTDAKTYQVKFENVDFGKTKSTHALKLTARTLSKTDETNVLEFYADSTDTEPIGRFYAKDGITAGNVCEYPVEISGGINGVHDIYVKWTGQWILFDFTCMKGTANVFGTDPDGVIYAATSSIRSSVDAGIKGNSGNIVGGIGKNSNVDSVSFPGLDFGTNGVSKLTVKISHNAQDTFDGTVRVLLGDRNGTELASKPISEVSNGTFTSYDFPISSDITGIHMITVTSDSQISLEYVAFNLDGEPVVIDPATALDGHQPVSVLDCTEVEGGTFTSSNTGGAVSVYAPVYTSGIAEGSAIKFNLTLENAKYAAICAKSRNTEADSVVGISKGSAEIASITLPQTDRNGTGWYMDVYTAELDSPITGTSSYSLTMKTNSSNIAWIQFMTEEQYSEFVNNRTKVALLGDSNVEYGKYTVALREMLDVNKYDLKSLGNSGKTVRNYKQQTQYQDALDYAPDIAVFTLGTNDSAQSCDDNYMSAFKTDYKDLIDGLKNVNPNVKIYLQYPLPFKSDAPQDYTNYSTDNLTNKIIPAIKEVADAEGAEIIDIYNGILNYGYDRELLYTDGLHVNEAGGTIMAKLTKAAVTNTDTANGPSVQTENGVEYVIATDADIINSATAANTSAATNYSFRSLKGLETPFISGYGDGTVIMLKDVVLDNVSAFTVRASNILEVSQEPLKVECHLDSVSGRLIGSTVITKNTNDTKYAFMPYKNAIDPVCDGKTHNLFFVLRRGTDANGTVRAIDGVYSIGFEYGMAKNIAVFEDGILQDTMPVVNSDKDSTAKFTGYKAGHEYTWKTTSDGNSSAELFVSVYDANGALKQLDVADKTNNILTASLTLGDDFDDTYTIKSIVLDSIGTLKPVLKNPDMQTTDKITIGCVGDSITNNWNSDDEGYQAYCYPKFLQAMLGTEKYEVMNFGRGTSTASSYKSNPWFERAKAAACDVYIIMLGTNDSKSSQYYEAIPTDYQAIIDGLKAANPDCKIYINLPVPAHGDNYGISDTVIENEVIPRIKTLAAANGIEPLDLHTMLEENPNFDYMYFSDNIHPSEFGQSFIAECVKNAYFAD